ncbi:MAG: hypothetical protein CMM84_20890 [Rhodothermaceae bacterium]|nr:hypothetical protein [Rhodothermaceae bacterium]
MPADPVAFLSYVHFDDDHNHGRITTLRERLEGEIETLYGRPVRILQDRTGIGWGEPWERWIEDSLDAVAFLIPVVTPKYFQSDYCRAEFERFRERERQLGREDLILPIYFVDADEVNEEAVRVTDPIAVELHRRQYADCRDLRHESLTSAAAGRRLEGMARKIKAALPPPPGRPSRPRRRSAPTDSAPSAPVFEQTSPSSRNEPTTVTVDGMGRGDYTSLVDAVRAAQAGTRILVRPGLYTGGIVLDKPLEIVGDGPLAEIEVVATGETVLRFETTMGRVSGLTIKQRGGDGYGVEIAQGRLFLESCDVKSEGLSCVAVHSGADPVVRGNRIHDGKQAGVFVYEDGRGTYEDNDVFANAGAGFAVQEGADPVVRGNRIHHGKQSGVYIHTDGRGTYEDNDVFANAYSGFEVKTGADPVVRGNRIHDGKGGGVYIHTDGRGTYEDNDVFANAYTGFEVMTGADPVVRGNRISANTQPGIWVHEGGKGTYERNHLWDNKRGPWAIAADAGEVTRLDNIEAAPS